MKKYNSLNPLQKEFPPLALPRWRRVGGYPSDFSRFIREQNPDLEKFNNFQGLMRIVWHLKSLCSQKDPSFSVCYKDKSKVSSLDFVATEKGDVKIRQPLAALASGDHSASIVLGSPIPLSPCQTLPLTAARHLVGRPQACLRGTRIHAPVPHSSGRSTRQGSPPQEVC